MRTSLTVVTLAILVSAVAHAATGVCDANPPTSTDACIAAIQSGGTVVNDIFRDTSGRAGPDLPVFGTLFNQWPGCDGTSFAGCSGTSNPPFDCPGGFTCTGEPNTFANASASLAGLDRTWWHPCRLATHDLDANGCPAFTACIADGTGGSYFPWEGVVFDLGGQANQVAVFADNDHGPQPCESTEYTVFLSDNPMARDLVENPAADGIDPTKWNRAVLSSVFTKGWIEVRPPDPVGHAACGDTSDYSVEEDSFVTVYALPCGVTFRYAAVVAGNDGLDFPECGFDSSEAELDAVAGLTQDGSAVCPDADGDLYPDCNCPTAPAVCDCDDSDATVHPGALEACDSPDKNCDGAPGACDAGLTCHDGECLAQCIVGEVAFCPGGATCASTDEGLLCVPQDCTQSGCPTGAVCAAGRCVPDCSGVVCPDGETCRDGVCIDACAGVVCPDGQVCGDGACKPPCTCLAGDLGCADVVGSVCGASGACVAPACATATCDAGDHCDETSGTCVAECVGVVCPFGQACIEGQGCVSSCASVTCTGSLVCDPGSATCVDPTCVGVICSAPAVCVQGSCTDVSDAGVTPGTDGGTGPHADAGSGSGDGVDAGQGGGGAPRGCGCGASDLAGTTGFALFAAVLARRRAAGAPKRAPAPLG